MNEADRKVEAAHGMPQAENSTKVGPDLWREPYSIEWYKSSEFAQRKGRGGMSLQTTWGNP